MKKIFLLLLVFLCLILCTACGNANEEKGGIVIIRFLDPYGDRLADDLFIDDFGALDSDAGDVIKNAVGITVFDDIPENYVLVGWDSNGDGKADSDYLEEICVNDTIKTPERNIILVSVFEKFSGVYMNSHGVTFTFDNDRFSVEEDATQLLGDFSVKMKNGEMRISLLEDTVVLDGVSRELSTPIYIYEDVPLVVGNGYIYIDGKKYYLLSETN